MLTRRKLTVNDIQVPGLPTVLRWRALRWLPAALLIVGLFYLSQQSSPPQPAGSTLSPILGHAGLYAMLAVFLYLAIAPRNGTAPRWVTATIAFSLAVLYGVSDEVHQAFVAGRVASEADILVDAVGAAIGIALVQVATLRIFSNNP